MCPLIYSMTLTEKVESCPLVTLRDVKSNKSHLWVYQRWCFQAWLNPEDTDLRNSSIHLWITYLSRLSVESCWWFGELLGSVFEEHILSMLLFFLFQILFVMNCVGSSTHSHLDTLFITVPESV